MSATRDLILSAPDLKRERTDIDEWGMEVDARELSGLDRKRFYELVQPKEGEKIDLLRYHAAAVVLGACEPGGGPIFNQGEGEIEAEISAVSAKSARVFFPLGARILDISGIGVKAEERAKKNSGGGARSE